jgi:hypothetical protein
MEVCYSVYNFSPTLDGYLGVYYHNPCLPNAHPSNPFPDTILMVAVERAAFICCTTGGEHRVEGLIIVLCLAIITRTLSDLISQHGDSDLKCLVGGGASFRLLVKDHPFKRNVGIVIYK